MLFTSGMLVDWLSADIRVLLLSTESTYDFDPDDQFLVDLWDRGAVEIGVAGYQRQAVTGRQILLDEANDRLVFDSDDIDFGTLAAGQNVSALVLYQRVGGDDNTPEDDQLLLYDDGSTSVVLAADAISSDSSIWVEPLPESLASGTQLSFEDGANATLGMPAVGGDRQLFLSTALGDDVSAGTLAPKVSTSRVLTQAMPPALAYLQNSDFAIPIDLDGWFSMRGKGGR